MNYSNVVNPVSTDNTLFSSHFQGFLKNVSLSLQYIENIQEFLVEIIEQVEDILQASHVFIIEGDIKLGYRVFAGVLPTDSCYDESDIFEKNALISAIALNNKFWGYIIVNTADPSRVWQQAELEFIEQLSIYLGIAIYQDQLKQKLARETIQKETSQREALAKAYQELNKDLEDIFNTNQNNCSLDTAYLYKKLNRLEKVKRRLEQANIHGQLLNDLSNKIRQFIILDDILYATVYEVREALKFDRLLVYKVEKNGGGKVIMESTLPYYNSLLGFKFTEETFPLECQQKLATLPYRAYNNAREGYQDYPCMVELVENFEIKSKAIIPIAHNNNLWGFLIAHQCANYREWEKSELELLSQLSSQLAIAIRQSNLYQRLEEELDERLKAEETIKQSLAEKELLLKEIHHRVKNNLNVVSSLLNLQTSYLEDPAIIEMFMSSQNRIQSMALIHEQLYCSDNLAKLDLGNYINNLVQHLQGLYDPTRKRIKFNLSLPSITLNLETAIPCGLIINELIINAFKHAFPNDISGEITINLYSEGLINHLELSDNGVGVSSNINLQLSSSLGLRLVRLLAMQLDTELEIQQLPIGTGFKISFSELEYSTVLK